MIMKNNCPELQGIEEDGVSDYYIITDGSGYTDGLGGFACCIVETQNYVATVIYGGQTSTSVPRQEFKALLEALQFIYQSDKRVNLTITHYSDCEALTKCIGNDYKRSSNTDLWAFFEFFEQYYSVDSNYIPRDTNMEALKLCDLHASSMRELLKHYKKTLN